MNEAVKNGENILGKLFSGDISAFTLSDLIWLVGAVVLVVLAVKVAARFMKVILTLAAIAVIVVFLFSSGIF